MGAASCVLSREVVDRITEHAEQEAPNEACGLLGGQGRVVTSAHPMQNMASSPLRYLIDSDAAASVAYELVGQGLDVVGVYHSHPTAPAVPSRSDIELSLPCLYVIVSLAAHSIRAWELGVDVREVPWAYPVAA